MAAPDQYRTLSAPAQAELRVKASRFFGFADRIGDESAAAHMRQQLKKQFHDAAHQPFALRLADGVEKCSDDGEPKGTAGPPILLEIRRLELCDVQLVVVRYFGGTKLGRGGLTRAFGECARLTLADASVITARKTALLRLVLAPDEVQTARRICSDFDAAVHRLFYDDNAHLQISLPQSRMEACRSALLERFGTRIFDLKG
jgi:uncharacterized YigZ family protein